MNKTKVIYGIRPVLEALKSKVNIDKILLQDSLQGVLIQELKQELKRANIRPQYVPVNRLNAIIKGNHQGVVAYISEIVYADLDDILLDLKQKNSPAFFLLLDKITDVRNFGAIARTAAAANVDAIIIPSWGAARINEDAIKTSAGGLLKVPVVKTDNLKTTIHTLHQEGITTICATEKAKDNYTSLNGNEPLAVILGSEDKGIDPDILKLARKQVSIPVNDAISSLNVSVAAGIIIYEVLRQRN
ncbi:MAG: 23S rRNA (guanosine(2251)-2'-O)-methyltransferase RlmB [Bacteroidales bacterium]|jgi:23S rRNA (guanosine2251-2'-O)-methyltransferase|nr:23S rRNA (guanosine(2251)-2'-O)-methyltransferase RlmB [Bacteroidales bacterium]